MITGKVKTSLWKNNSAVALLAFITGINLTSMKIHTGLKFFPPLLSHCSPILSFLVSLSVSTC